MLVVPERMVWVDIVAPAGWAPDDVRGSMIWAGQMWKHALAPSVADGGALDVHTGAIVTTAWSDLVCFAGLGPGEVSRDGRKLVGLSQRRTRAGIRIQGTLYTEQPAIEIATLLRRPVPVGPLPEIATLAVDRAALVERLSAQLR